MVWAFFSVLHDPGEGGGSLRPPGAAGPAPKSETAIFNRRCPHTVAPGVLSHGRRVSASAGACRRVRLRRRGSGCRKISIWRLGWGDLSSTLQHALTRQRTHPQHRPARRTPRARSPDDFGEGAHLLDFFRRRCCPGWWWRAAICGFGGVRQAFASRSRQRPNQATRPPRFARQDVSAPWQTLGGRQRRR